MATGDCFLSGLPFRGVRNRRSPRSGSLSHPQTGGPVTPTIACRMQMLRRGEKLKPRRVTGSSVFHVVRGKGRTVINGKAYDWEKGDIVALPSWAQHAHENRGNEPALLFSISDRPVIEALGFYREET